MINDELTQSIKGIGDKFFVHGLTTLKPKHPDVMRLRDCGYRPTEFGSNIWRSSYLLIDYLSGLPLSSKQHIVELGCGWGLPATYVQKRFGAQVTAVDIDENVFAYQKLISRINNADIATKCSSFGELCERDLSDVDILIGSDICYTFKNIKDLEKLFHKFFSESDREIILTDSGRSPFFQLAEALSAHYPLHLTDTSIRLPTRASGHVLHVRLPS